MRNARGFDFTGYKRSTLSRRIARRVQALGLQGCTQYLEYIEANPAELGSLFDTILINVTSFFRDEEAWTYLATQVVPEILRRKGPHEGIRVWSAGCASGEEPYSIAILLAEALGIEEYTRRVKIYATDLDDQALETARRARYRLEQLEPVPPDLRARYFQFEDNSAQFHGILRRSVIFGRHDLLEDAPISHLDLLLCRNVVMYFNLQAQARVLSRLNFALDQDGFLCLGRAEMLLSHGYLFVPAELKHRVFRKNRRAEAVGHGSRGMPRAVTGHADPSRPSRLRDAALHASAVAQVVVDDGGRLALYNEQAASIFRLGRPDLRRPLQDLELSYRPVELRSLIEEAHEHKAPVVREAVERQNGESGPQFLDVVVVPLLHDELVIGTSISFHDVTHHQRLQENLQRFGESLETAYEEVQSANEELETTNEELQSSNEELETTNEELQAANEEMETVNEELRSANEELQHANEQLRRREGELNRANTFLSSILGGLRAAVLVVDGALQVQIWSRQAEELWGLRRDEVIGSPLLSLDIGVPIQDLAEVLHQTLTGRHSEEHEFVLDGHDRRGRRLRCRVRVSPLCLDDQEPGAIVLLEPTLGEEE